MSEYIYRPTTAFWKIHELVNQGLGKFQDDEQKVFVIQGGQGAGKTISILMLIIDFFRLQKSEITICSSELSKLKATALNDFIKILKDYGMFEQSKYNKSNSVYHANTGHFVEFIGLDKSDIGKGRRRKLVYINEANKITLQQYTDITARADIVVMDYNPDGKFWGHDLIQEHNYINLTYLDNEYLSANEVSNILAYKKRGFNDDGTVKNEYWANKWRVYGLGETGSVEGRIYKWGKCSKKHFQEIKKEVYYGVDWGAVDPFAVVEVKYDDGTLYVNEINYESENKISERLLDTQLQQIKSKQDGLVSYLFNKWNIPKDKMIICDNNRPNKIISLRQSGWEYAVAVGKKSKLIDRINTLQQINIVYTDCSQNIDYEQFNYQYAKDRNGNKLETPLDADNHTIDAISYVCQKLFDLGVIKVA